MIVGILKETFPSEHRVAIVPDVGATLQDKDVALVIETGAGIASGFSDAAYEARDFEVVAERAAILERSDVLLQVRTPGANPVAGEADLAYLKAGQVLIGMAEPLMAHTTTEAVARLGVVLFGMELIPRITRAQSMDVFRLWLL
jgi:NAD(P) transhydrogenase subunit alpha